MNKERFLCYIQGGTPKGATRDNPGCRDQSLPVKEQSYVMKHELFFAKEAGRWQGKGVAFIDPAKNEQSHTYSYMYMITKEQFLDVVAQENSVSHVDLDIEKVIEKGNEVFRESWYGNVLYLGEADGVPIFTFTSPNELLEEELNPPSIEYVRTIMHGLKGEVGLTDDEIVSYLLETHGIKGFMSREQLIQCLGM
ncbi:hypothetical protein FN924_17975 [Radiobacillus deserti]|uniref:Uncharacterized protein n=2 Tax=Radiobacillus deserti TaxID=2594883 RepID=A0A516KLJ7_9BACI|nr:hypothetical protein FN924_17975 [Radiobacillus deserti]